MLFATASCSAAELSWSSEEILKDPLAQIRKMSVRILFFSSAEFNDDFFKKKTAEITNFSD